MRNERRGRGPVAWARLLAAFLVVAAFASPNVAARVGTEVELLSGVGYSSSTEGPSLLMGTEVSARATQGSFLTGMQETSIGLHVSDVLAVESLANTVTFGIEGAWARYRGPLSIRLSGQAFVRQQGSQVARTAGILGTGSFGRIQARFGVDYVESDQAAFPWFQKDLDGLLYQGGSEPFYRAHAGVSASILPASRMRWSQDVKWLRPVGERGVFSVTTGPEYAFGSSAVAAQAGILFTEDGIEPLWQVRYQLLNSQSPVEFQVTAATQSIEGRGPTLYGWFGYAGESFGLGAALQFERTPEGEFGPSIYVSFHPKF